MSDPSATQSQTGKRDESPYTISNVCCLAGIGMLLYAAFLLHSVVGWSVSGGALTALGVYLNRSRKGS